MEIRLVFEDRMSCHRVMSYGHDELSRYREVGVGGKSKPKNLGRNDRGRGPVGLWVFVSLGSTVVKRVGAALYFYIHNTFM